MAIHELKSLNVVSRQGVVGQEDSSGIHHECDIGHGQCLLKPVVVDEDVGGNHQVKRLARFPGNVLRDDVQIQRRHTRRVARRDCHCPDGYPAKSLRHWKRLGLGADCDS